MDRSEFVEGYMTRSGLLPYSLDGERVVFVMESGGEWVQLALPCNCDEEGCGGWAMIQDGQQNWHRFQNGLTDMSFEEACNADDAIQEARFGQVI